jgi:DNA-binding winged helix-turn-helix (wHTH) protein/cytochrome c551/c552
MSCISELVPSTGEGRTGGLDGRWPERRDIVAFGPFRLSAAERRLERDGVALKLGSRALDILIALVERASEVVSKRELFARVWPNLVVDDGSLRFHVAALRKALGAGQSGVRYVANVSGRGYCFVAPISRLAAMPPEGRQFGRARCHSEGSTTRHSSCANEGRHVSTDTGRNESELNMKVIPLFSLCVGCALSAMAAEAAANDADAAKLAAKYNCQACHTVDKKLIGPTFREVAAKYAGDEAALEKLQVKVKNGSTGVWGQIPMPPNNVPAAQLATLVQWILSLK